LSTFFIFNINVSFDFHFAVCVAELTYIRTAEVILRNDFGSLIIENELVLALIRTIWSNLSKGALAQCWQGFIIFFIDYILIDVFLVPFLLEKVFFFFFILIYFRLFFRVVFRSIIYLFELLLHFSCLSFVPQTRNPVLFFGLFIFAFSYATR